MAVLGEATVVHSAKEAYVLQNGVSLPPNKLTQKAKLT